VRSIGKMRGPNSWEPPRRAAGLGYYCLPPVGWIATMALPPSANPGLVLRPLKLVIDIIPVVM